MMNAINETIGTVAETLKGQPLAAALVLVNLMFLVGGGWVLHEVGQSMRSERAAMLAAITSCLKGEQP